MVNIPRALFTGRTGREPRYHVAIAELQDWAYTGERLVPLKGYPGIVWERPNRESTCEALTVSVFSTLGSRPRMPPS